MRIESFFEKTHNNIKKNNIPAKDLSEYSAEKDDYGFKLDKLVDDGEFDKSLENLEFSFSKDEIDQSKQKKDFFLVTTIDHISKYLSKNKQEENNIAEKLMYMRPEVLSMFHSLADYKKEDVLKIFNQYIDFLESAKNKCVIDFSFLNNLSKIYFNKNSSEITFVNSVRPVALEYWKKANDAGIPVAPILDIEERERTLIDRENNNLPRKRVYSRYSGLTFDKVSRVVPEIVTKYIANKVMKLDNELKKIGINHNDYHSENITVEFIKKDYLKSIHGNKNKIPFNKDAFSFDPITFMENPSEWEIIVRYIDWESPVGITNE